MDHLRHEGQFRGLEGSFRGKVGSSDDSAEEWERLKGSDVAIE